jgi:hypothetical protein
MSGELTRRYTGSVERVPRQVQRAVTAAHYQGLVAAARVQATAYTTQVALSLVGQLSAEEARLIEQSPLGEPRYKAIVDSFAGAACTEIARLAW